MKRPRSAAPQRRATPPLAAVVAPQAPTAEHKAPSFVPSGRSSLVRIERIHQLISAVTREGLRRVSVASLAADLGVARNTVKVDLDLLRIFNAPLDYDDGRRTWYYTTPGWQLRPPVWLQDDEALAVLTAIRLARQSRVFPMGPALAAAFERIAPMLAGAASFGPETLDPVFSTPDCPGSAAESGNFARLSEAIAQRRPVRVGYEKLRPAGVPEMRTLHPLHWFLRPDACLLIAHDPAIGERRIFELVRIQTVEVSGETFDPPRGFDLRKFLAGSFGRFVGDVVHEVRVRFDRDYVPLVRERPWQPGQVLEEQPDGTALATYRMCHTADLEQYVLRAGGQVEVLSPPDVRVRIQATAARIAARHVESAKGGSGAGMMSSLGLRPFT